MPTGIKLELTQIYKINFNVLLHRMAQLEVLLSLLYFGDMGTP